MKGVSARQELVLVEKEKQEVTMKTLFQAATQNGIARQTIKASSIRTVD